MSTPGEVLVAIMNNRDDFVAARDEHWYRIPVVSATKWVGERWPPKWLAFYQTKEFGPEAHAVNYYAKVGGIREVERRELFPDQPRNAKSMHRYYRLALDPLEQLTSPIPSRRNRKIIFIPTTWKKFAAAAEINDLSDESPLEDRLWAAFKERRIPAERQYFLEIEAQHYALDFAIYCEEGKINVETDGDTWHTNLKNSTTDRHRDNAMTTKGWRVLRFSTRQVMEALEADCLARVIKNINELGGLDEGGVIPRKIDSAGVGRPCQKGLFDEL